MTRAREELHLTVPQRFFVRQQTAHGDRHVYASRSRFIPNALTSLFETCGWPAAPQPDDGADSTQRDSAPRIDVAARVRALWR
jgi:DNA helicase-2/ATP-dependent DNA helicase PcrA